MTNATEPTTGGERLLPWRAVRALTGISRTTLWRLQKAGRFPRPVEVSPGRIAWRERDVAAWTAGLTPRGEPPAPPTASPTSDAAPGPAPEPRADAAPQARRSQRPTPAPVRRRRPRSGQTPAAQSRQMSFDF